MIVKDNKTKLVRFTESKWAEHRANADQLAKGRGITKMSIADYLNETAKHFESTRPRVVS